MIAGAPFWQTSMKRVKVGCDQSIECNLYYMGNYLSINQFEIYLMLQQYLCEMCLSIDLH
jgi:hypothetical protein